jgi:hypothetical protein
MEMLSQEYGWLPSQIKRESYSDIAHYIKIIQIKRKLQEADMKQIKQHGK